MTEQTTIPNTPAILGLAAQIEALLFISGEPLGIDELARALERPAGEVAAALDALAESCAERGVRVQRHEGRAQLVSAPEAAGSIIRLIGGAAPQRVSGAALEVLAIIAYRQPITRAQIEAVRGVDSGGVIRVLLGRELIAETGRLESVGRPILYGTTADFLRQFGIGCLAELPPLDSFAMPELPAEA